MKKQWIILGAAALLSLALTACGILGGLRYTSNGDGTCTVSHVGMRILTDTEVVIPSVSPNGDTVTSIGEEAFWCCSGLTSVVIPDSVTFIGDYAFYECTGLTSIEIPDSVTYIGEEAFYECTGLTSITVGSGNTVYHSAGNCLIETAAKTLIVGCKNSVIPTDGSVTSIGSFAFSGCTGLTSIEIPDSVTSIDYFAFCECTGLTSIEIPDSVTSIGNHAFYECTGLTSIEIPDSVTSIGWGAFYECTGLTSIVYGGTKAQWNAIDKDSDWNYDTGNYTIHCTDGDLSEFG